jgi:hypothetical protein
MQRYCLDCGKPIVRYDAKRCRSCSKKGKLSVNFGQKFSKERRKNMSEHHSNVKGKNNPNWNGGTRTSWGYVYVYFPEHPFAKKNYVKRADLVMEKKLGRYLKPKEVIHHKNLIKTDDNISNLILCENESEHQLKYHARKKQNGNP